MRNGGSLRSDSEKPPCSCYTNLTDRAPGRATFNPTGDG